MRGFSVTTLKKQHDWVVQQNEEFKREFGIELYDEPVEEEPVSYLDHFAASEVEKQEILGIVQNILSAESQQERDEIVSYCASTSYPQLVEMLAIACRAVIEKGDLEEARSFGESLRESYPQYVDTLYKALSA